MTQSLVPPADLEALVAFRHEMHRHPETGFDVPNTSAMIARRLIEAGLSVTTGIAGHGLVATLKRGHSNRAIGLRADMDALPITEQTGLAYRSGTDGQFHGCGHDGHSTMLLGAALRLARHGQFDGSIHFIFQPDEENGRGAQAMIDDGLFQRFPMDAIFGIHNLPGMPLGHFATQTGPLTAFEETFEIRIQGRGGHASAPENVVDPLVTAAEIVVALQSIVARSLSPKAHGVVSVTEFLTDGARNIIPSNVTLRGDTRGYSDEVSAILERRMGAIARGIAAAHGATATLDYRREFEPVVNDAAAVKTVSAAAGRVAGATMDAAYGKVGFSEDFAQFLKHCPGCFLLMGNGSGEHHGAPLHNPHYDFNDAALPFGVAFWCALAEVALEA